MPHQKEKTARTVLNNQNGEVCLNDEGPMSWLEAEYEEAVKADPAMPVLNAGREAHRERLLSCLYNQKLLEVSLEMYDVVTTVLSAKEAATHPAAQAAPDKEWQKLVDKGCWVEKKARECEYTVTSVTFSKSAREPSSRQGTPTGSIRAGQYFKAKKSLALILVTLFSRRCLVVLRL